ncbi:MAG: hypothetical protein JWQ43_2302, partial [Glaciihabitans sp.]|nr:hypothetical protein [Glaciihabitans sp.]
MTTATSEGHAPKVVGSDQWSIGRIA